MRLYLVTQTNKTGYDVYDSAVVCADSEDGSKQIEVGSTGSMGTWVSPRFVKVKYLGEADPAIKRGVICASFNAG